MPTPWVGADRPDRRKVGDVFSDRGERLGDESGGGAVQGVGVYGRSTAAPALGRFVQPDTVVPEPGDAQGLNRFAYVRNNPLRYTDPTGHCIPGVDCPGDQSEGDMTTQSPTPGYNSDDATSTAVEILWWWFFELGPEEVWFGPSNSLTQDVAHDPGMDWFRQEWARAGYQVPFELEHHADPRGGTAQDIVVGMGVFVREHLIELPRAVGEMVWSYATGRPSAQPPGEVTAVGGVIGSLDQIVVSEAGPCTVRIEVINHTDWKSGLRIYGTDESLLPPYEREAWGPGGRLTEHFYWWEPWPYCGRR